MVSFVILLISKINLFYYRLLFLLAAMQRCMTFPSAFTANTGEK